MKRLGSPPKDHQYWAAQGLRKAHAAQLRAKRLAGGADHPIGKRCDKIWDELLTAQARLSFAYAHLESYNARGKSMNAFYTLQNRQAHLRETIGWQCTRKK